MLPKYKMGLESNIWKFYLYRFFGPFYHIPIFVVYLQGFLSLTEIMVLELIAAIVLVLFEIPSGAFADIFGRKASLYVSVLTFAAAYSMYIFAPMLGVITFGAFVWFILARFLSATGASFASGADSAFLYDTLKELKTEHRYKKIEGNSLFYRTIGLAVAALIASLLVKISLIVPYIVDIIIMLLISFLILTLIEPKVHKKVKKEHYWLHQKQSIFYVLTHKRLRWLTGYYAIVYGFVFIATTLFFQPYLREINIPVVYFGVIYSVGFILSSLFAKYSEEIESTLGERLSLYSMPIFLGIVFLLMAQFKIFWAFIFLYFQQFVFAYINPVINHYTHEHLESHQRATVLSIRNLASSLILLIFSPFLGWIADIYSLSTALKISAAILLVFSAIISLLWEVKK